MKKLLLVPVMAALLLTGCVVGTRNIALTIPEYDSGKSASGPVYIGAIEDKRSFEQKPRSPSTPSVDGKLSDTSAATLSTLVGRQRSQFGKAMGDVALAGNSTVQDRVRALLTAALESRGYDVVEDSSAPTKVSVVIEEFWAWFSPGFWSVSFESDLQCHLNFETPSGNVALNVVGSGVNIGQVASDANWALAYQFAFEDFLKNMDEQLDLKGL